MCGGGIIFIEKKGDCKTTKYSHYSRVLIKKNEERLEKLVVPRVQHQLFGPLPPWFASVKLVLFVD